VERFLMLTGFVIVGLLAPGGRATGSPDPSYPADLSHSTISASLDSTSFGTPVVPAILYTQSTHPSEMWGANSSEEIALRGRRRQHLQQHLHRTRARTRPRRRFDLAS